MIIFTPFYSIVLGGGKEEGPNPTEIRETENFIIGS